MSDKSVQSLSLSEPCEFQGSFWELRRAPVSHVPLETVPKATADPGIPVLLSHVPVISGDESFRILWVSCMKRHRGTKQWVNTHNNTGHDCVHFGLIPAVGMLKRLKQRNFYFGLGRRCDEPPSGKRHFSQWVLSVKDWRGSAVWALRKRGPLKRVHNSAERVKLLE